LKLRTLALARTCMLLLACGLPPAAPAAGAAPVAPAPAPTGTAAPAERQAHPELLATGRALSDAFDRGDLDTLLARATPAWRDGLGGRAGLVELRERVLRDEGAETGLIEEQARVDGPYRIYRRIARRTAGTMPTLMEWTLDRDGHIVALEIRPQAVAMPTGKVGY
jgi:hypothetical protein